MKCVWRPEKNQIICINAVNMRIIEYKQGLLVYKPPSMSYLIKFLLPFSCIQFSQYTLGSICVLQSSSDLSVMSLFRSQVKLFENDHKLLQFLSFITQLMFACIILQWLCKVARSRIKQIGLWELGWCHWCGRTAGDDCYICFWCSFGLSSLLAKACGDTGLL